MAISSARRPIKAIIGPAGRGARMSLTEFARADCEPGRTYELERGVVVVVDVPGVPHSRIVQRIRLALLKHQEAHPAAVDLVAGGTDSVMRMPRLITERHPDLVVYLRPPPTKDEQVWDRWTPEIVVEVVSRDSRKRDYQIKPADYLAAGVHEYWIVDPLTRNATLHARRGDEWVKRRLPSSGVIRTPLMAGFALRLADIFAALK